MVELSNFDIVCCKVPILISTVDDQGYLSNYSSFSLVFVEDLCTYIHTYTYNKLLYTAIPSRSQRFVMMQRIHISNSKQIHTKNKSIWKKIRFQLFLKHSHRTR